MVEWIALALSVIALLLEREKISKFFADFTDWRSRKKYKREGELFVKHITRIHKRDDLMLCISCCFSFSCLVVESLDCSSLRQLKNLALLAL